MPYFTVHEERLYVIEAETGDDALLKYESAKGRPSTSAFHIECESSSTYVTDEYGVEV